MDEVVDRLTRSGAALPAGLMEAVRTAALLGLPMEARLELPADRFHLEAERARFDRPEVILVLADPAFTRCALRWQRPAARSVRTLEFVFPGQPAAATAALRRLASPADLPGGCDPGEASLAARATAFITASACADVGALPAWLGAAESPDRVRRVWHALERLKVLVPWGPGGEAATTTLAILEEIALHALDRSRQILNGHRLSTSSRRPEFLRDLRALLQAAEMAPARDPAVYIRRQLLQRNLHLTLGPESLTSVTAWVARAAARDQALVSLDANLHLHDPARRQVHAASDGTGVGLLWAWRAAREARLIDQPGNDFELAAARIDSRRTALGSPWFRDRGGGDADLEWGTAETDRFDLVPGAAEW